MQADQVQGQVLLLVNGTIRLTGAVQITGESSTLFSECFVLRLNAEGQVKIMHQVFKVHKPPCEDSVAELKCDPQVS